jgi:hypothetical protein
MASIPRRPVHSLHPNPRRPSNISRSVRPTQIHSVSAAHINLRHQGSARNQPNKVVSCSHAIVHIQLAGEPASDVSAALMHSNVSFPHPAQSDQTLRRRQRRLMATMITLMPFGHVTMRFRPLQAQSRHPMTPSHAGISDVVLLTYFPSGFTRR